MGLFAWLRGGTHSVNTFEAAILAEVEKLLEPEMASRWRARIDAINLVQRHTGGKDVFLYQSERKQPIFPEKTAIVDDSRLIDFALVETRSSGNAMSRLRATIGLMRGNLASIAFDKPSEHADLADVEDMRARLLGPPFRDPDSESRSADGWPTTE
jgi:hypothetical protein